MRKRGKLVDIVVLLCHALFTATQQQVQELNERTNIVTSQGPQVTSKLFTFAHEESLVLNQGLLASQDGNALVLKMIAHNKLFP